MDRRHEYNDKYTEDRELNIPSTDDYSRNPWDMKRDPYQTLRPFREPGLDVNFSFPGQTSAMNVSDSSNENKEDNQLWILPTENYSRNHWDTKEDPYQTLRSYKVPTLDENSDFPRQKSAENSSVSNDVDVPQQLSAMNSSVSNYAGFPQQPSAMNSPVSNYAGFPQHLSAMNSSVSKYAGFPQQPNAMNSSVSNYAGFPQQPSAMNSLVSNYPGFPQQHSAMNSSVSNYAGFPQQHSAMNSSVSNYAGFQQQPSTIKYLDSNYVVVTQPVSSPGIVHVPDYTYLSVFVIMCCCIFIGLCAVRSARDAKMHLQQGNMQEALAHARGSRNLNVTGIIVGPIISVALILVRIYASGLF